MQYIEYEPKSVFLILVHPLAKRLRRRWIWSRGRKYEVYMKLDPIKIEWIVRQKENGTLNSQIASVMGVSVRRVQEIWSSYRSTGHVPVLKRPGRKITMTTEEEVRLVRETLHDYHVNALALERIIHSVHGVRIPHNRIHRVLKEMGLVKDEPKKQRRRKWVRYEREYSNSMWHADWTLIEGKGWMIAYLDDASRFVTGYGIFPEQTSERSVEVLQEAIQKYGKPASILTDHGAQFYANEADDRLRGITQFEKFLIEQEIRHVLSRVNHPQTNGKVERFFGTVKAKLPVFLGDVDGLVKWYNFKRPHMSLDFDNIETPYQAFVRKMPKPGMVADERSGEVYRAKQE